MKKPRLVPRPAGPRRAIQLFTYGPLEFNANKAAVLAANVNKYPPQSRQAVREWIGPHIEIKEAYIEQSDVSQPIIFATIITEDHPWPLLIDGNHRLLKALRHGVPIKVVTLDLEDTLKIIRGPAPMIERMKRHGQRLGLLKDIR